MALDAGTGDGALRTAPADALCPRCARRFHCGIDDPRPCACTTLHLSTDTLAALRARYDGCLCLACLSELARIEDGTASAAPSIAPAEGRVERWLDRLTVWLAPLAIVVTALLFLQWPLRDVVHAGSTQANDLAQWLFALYVAWSIRHASRHGAHLTARGDLAPLCDPASSRRSRWRAVGAALCLLPWGLYLLVAAWPEVAQAVAGRERFPETDSPGYFMTYVALALLAVLAVWQGGHDLWRSLRPPRRR